MSADQIEWLHSLIQELENAGVELPMGNYLDVYDVIESIREQYTAHTYQDMAALLEGMTESEGFLLFHAMRNKFQWTGTVFCRGDVESIWQDMNETEDDLPDEVWHKVQDDWGWRHMADVLAEDGNESIRQALLS